MNFMLEARLSLQKDEVPFGAAWLNLFVGHDGRHRYPPKECLLCCKN